MTRIRTGDERFDELFGGFFKRERKFAPLKGGAKALDCFCKIAVHG